MSVNIMELFRFVRREFRLSPEVIKKYFFTSLIYLHIRMNILMLIFTYVIYAMLNKQESSASGKILIISGGLL